MEKISIKLKNGYSLHYETTSNTGSITNIDPDNKDLEVNIEKIGDSYYINFYLSGVLIQIWCKSYRVEKMEV